MLYICEQVFGRFLMVFAVLMPAVEIHTHPVVLVLFLAWSLIEIIRWVSRILGMA